jgi:aspartyl-tRNA(Asn)/glutamyl-tRNA(Gln) amidotransferase subunit C
LITREEIQNIAILSKLFIDENELDTLTQDMAQIITFADTINTAVEELEDFEDINNLSNVFREDEVLPSYDRSLILKNVDGGENGYFPVKKRV